MRNAVGESQTKIAKDLGMSQQVISYRINKVRQRMGGAFNRLACIQGIQDETFDLWYEALHDLLTDRNPMVVNAMMRAYYSPMTTDEVIAQKLQEMSDEDIERELADIHSVLAQRATREPAEDKSATPN